MSLQSRDPSHMPVSIHSVPLMHTCVLCQALSPRLVIKVGQELSLWVPQNLLVSADLTSTCSGDSFTGGSTGSRPRAQP